MKFALFALLACASAVRLVAEPSDKPAKAPKVVKDDKPKEESKETMDERIRRTLEPRIQANKDAQQAAWNAGDKAAAQDRAHARDVLKGVNAGVAEIKADIAACKETQANGRKSRKGASINDYPEDATITPSNSHCPN